MAKAVESNVLVDACCLDPFTDYSIDFGAFGHMIKDKTFLSDSAEYLHRLITNWNGEFLLGLLQVQAQAETTFGGDVEILMRQRSHIAIS